MSFGNQNQPGKRDSTIPRFYWLPYAKSVVVKIRGKLKTLNFMLFENSTRRSKFQKHYKYSEPMSWAGQLLVF